MVSGQETERLSRSHPFIQGLVWMAVAGGVMAGAGQAVFSPLWTAAIQVICMGVACGVLQQHPKRR